MVTPKPVSEKLHPIPATRSAPCRKWTTGGGGGRAPCSQREGMVLREDPFRAQGGHDRGLEELRQLSQLVPGLRVEDSLAGVEHRAPGLEERRSGLLHVPGVPGGPAGWHRAIAEDCLVQVLTGHVGGELQEHRAGSPRAKAGEGPAEHLGYALHQVDLVGPLGHVGVAARRAEGRVDAGAVPGRSCRQEEDWRRVVVGLGHAGKTVLRPCLGLHEEHTRSPAVGHAAEAVHHVDAHPLLARDDEADVLQG